MHSQYCNSHGTLTGLQGEPFARHQRAGQIGVFEIAENVVGGGQRVRSGRGQIERVDAVTVVGEDRQRNG